jgi:hypothetical protein
MIGFSGYGSWGEIMATLRAAGPVYWDRFVESQETARVSVKLEGERDSGGSRESLLNVVVVAVEL